MQPSTPAQQRVDILIRRADRDMQVAELIVRSSPHLYEDAGFHCQQAVEKYLKAGGIDNRRLARSFHAQFGSIDDFFTPSWYCFIHAE